MKLQSKGFVFGMLTASMLSSAALAQDQTPAQNDNQDWQGEARDAWIDGKLEGSYLLNSELDGFKIGTDVENGRVVLTGTVPSDAHKQLAEEIANNLDGVTAVQNDLVVAEAGDEYDERDRNFSSRFYDMTTTVGLKSNFALNDELEAHEINIDTVDGVVTLEGEVDTRAEAMLAEEIASSYDHVSRVQNNLRVTTQN